jgi:hypothetical protein
VTIPKHDLLANKALALQLIGEHCGSAAIGEAYQKNEPHFQPILDTTWKALADDHYVRFSPTIWLFQLTAPGWVKALEATGGLCDEQMKKDLGTLSAALKDRLVRTKGPALVGIHEIVNETGLPHYWVVNAIRSHLIKHCLKRKDADCDDMEGVIEVPIDFGHPL